MMNHQREYAAWARGYKWASTLAAKMGRHNSCPLALENTFVFRWKLEQFEDDHFARDSFVAGYRDYHKQNRNKG